MAGHAEAWRGLARHGMGRLVKARLGRPIKEEEDVMAAGQPARVTGGRQPFEPIGEQARWRTVYALLRRQPVNSIITYQQVGDELGLDWQKERDKLRAPIRRAGQELETEDNQTIEVVPNLGYRVVHATEKLRIARGHQRRASRSLTRAHSAVVHVDMNELDPASRAAFEAVGTILAGQMDYLSRFARRQERHEKDLAAMSKKVDRSAAEMAQMRERLARLEASAPPDADGEA